MNKEDLIKKALFAVSDQQTSARNQARDASDLNRPDLVEYWSKQIKESGDVYQGLLAMLLEVDHEQP